MTINDVDLWSITPSGSSDNGHREAIVDVILMLNVVEDDLSHDQSVRSLLWCLYYLYQVSTTQILPDLTVTLWITFPCS